jgi:hypothetical protein
VSNLIHYFLCSSHQSLIKEIIMAAKNQTTSTTSPTVEDIMAQLRQPSSHQSFTDRVKNFVVDEVADSGQFVSRLSAGLVAAKDNFGDGYSLERERQLRRRAERILKLTQH